MVGGFASPWGALRFRAVVGCYTGGRVCVVGTGMDFTVLFLSPVLLSLSLCMGRDYQPPSM